MPKSKNAKHKQTAEPYSVSKKDNSSKEKDVSDSDDKETVLYCDKCTSAVECLLQCERCLVWHCLDCAKVTNNIMNVLDECEALHWFCEACNVKAVVAILAFNPSEPTQSLTNTIASVVQKSLDKVMDDLIKVISDKTEHLQQSVNQAVHTSADNLMDTEVVADGQSNTSLPSSGSVVDIVDEYVDRDRKKCNLNISAQPSRI